jgi:hypothetical protein
MLSLYRFELIIADQPAVAQLYLALLQGNALTAISSAPDVEVVLLSEIRTGDEKVDTLLTISMDSVGVLAVDPVPANEPGDPSLVRVVLGPTIIKLNTSANEESSFDFRTNLGTSCSDGIASTFANAPGAGNPLFGIPTTGFSLSTFVVDSGATGGGTRTTRPSVSELGVITGLVPETTCLAGWIFTTNPDPIEVDSYASSLDTNPYVSFLLKHPAITAFNLKSNIAGGTELVLSFAYGTLEIDYGGTTAQYPPDLRQTDLLLRRRN